MKRLASWLVVLATTGALAGACTTHGAGGRCDPLNVPAGTNQNADCDNGLVCISGGVLELPDGGGAPQGNFCCPTDRTTVDPSNICYASSTVPGDDASIPDTGTTETGSDAANDSASDASDAATDSSSDASDASDASGE